MILSDDTQHNYSSTSSSICKPEQIISQEEEEEEEDEDDEEKITRPVKETFLNSIVPDFVHPLLDPFKAYEKSEITNEHLMTYIGMKIMDILLQMEKRKEWAEEESMAYPEQKIRLPSLFEEVGITAYLLHIRHATPSIVAETAADLLQRYFPQLCSEEDESD